MDIGYDYDKYSLSQLKTLALFPKRGGLFIHNLKDMPEGSGLNFYKQVGWRLKNGLTKEKVFNLLNH